MRFKPVFSTLKVVLLSNPYLLKVIFHKQNRDPHTLTLEIHCTLKY